MTRSAAQPIPIALVVSVAVALLLTACGGGSSGSPTAPTPPPATGTPPPAGPPTGSSACRTLVTDSVTITAGVAAGQPLSSTTTQRCTFDRTAAELNCTTEVVDRSGTSTVTSAMRFGSVAAFVGDAPRIFIHATRETRPVSANTRSPFGGGTTTYGYDEGGRLLRMESRGDSGPPTVHSFTEWDPFGRPTAGRLDDSVVSYSFDDGQRTATVRNLTIGSTTTLRYNADGNTVETASTLPNGTNNSTTTIRSTTMVCR